MVKMSDRDSEIIEIGVDIARQYLTRSKQERTVVQTDFLKKCFQFVPSLDTPSEKRFYSFITSKLSGIRTREDYEAAGGIEFTTSVVRNMLTYAKRNAKGYFSNPEYMFMIFDELFDLEKRIRSGEFQFNTYLEQVLEEQEEGINKQLKEKIRNENGF